MKTTEKFDCPKFSESVMSLSKFYLINMHRPFDFFNPNISDDEKIFNTRFQLMCDIVLACYLKHGFSSMPEVELFKIAKYQPDIIKDFLTEHTKMPVNGESLIMERTRNVTGFSELLKNCPEILPFFEALHANWYSNATKLNFPIQNYLIK